jgi:hypothetical protein
MLARGGFRPAPAGQWDAELLGAHVSLLAEELVAVTEAILAGSPPERYDNARTVDDAVLRRYADEHGGIPGLAARVAELGPRLADLATRLGNTSAEVHVVYHDYGMRLGDRPGQWRDLLSTHTNRVYTRADELRRMR